MDRMLSTHDIASCVLTQPFTTGKLLLYLVFLFLTFTYFTFYGMVAVGLTPTQDVAAVVSSAFYSLWNLLSGFLIPQSVSY